LPHFEPSLPMTATSAPTPASSPAPASQAVGILLAGGRGARFDPSGQTNKLLAPLLHGAEPGVPIAWLAARQMRAALKRVIAVVRPDGAQAQELARLLEDAGCEVLMSAAAQRGMGASLAAGVRASLGLAPNFAAPLAATGVANRSSPGWVIALADMPGLSAATIARVSSALSHDDAIAAAWYRGVRGHPVGFGGAHGAALAQLDGDTGARALLQESQVIRIDTEDAGVLRDIDTPEAL